MGLPFDIIGEIAIAEVPEGAKPRETARRIMEKNKRVRTVYRKASGREGIYRTRRLRLIGGLSDPVTVHRENGICLKMDVRKVYFSPREGTERLRLAERISSIFSSRPACVGMTFFSGIGATPILLSKKTSTRSLVGIELNPHAVKYFRENIALNKAANVCSVLGDVRKEARKFNGICDFITMPLPETGWKFLATAMRCLSPRGVCFFYAISGEDDLYCKWERKIKHVANKLGKNPVFLERRKVLPYSSRKWKIRIDFRLE